MMWVVAPAAAGSSAPAGAYTPGSLTLDGETMHQVAALGEQMQRYLTLNPDGTLSLGQVDVAALNITNEYLENYKAALGYINAAIEQGLFTVDENFQVVWSEKADKADKATGEKTPQSTAPDHWYSYPIDLGLYVYFDYDDVYYYLPSYGLSTATSLASYVGRPYIAIPFTYHFTYYSNYLYYHQYAYSCCGLWVYVPWEYLPYYEGYYYPTYRYVYYWDPYNEYWYYPLCYY